MLGSVLRSSLLAATLPAVVAATLFARTAQGRPAGRDVPTVFFVAKSENRNQVHYGVHLDDNCAPVGVAPAFAYWRMFEHGPRATEPLLSREIGAYGFLDQRVIERGPEGGRVWLRLHALPSRPIVVRSGRSGDACDATATMAIAGVPAALGSVFVQLRWPFGVAHLVLTGRALADGRSVTETVPE